PRRRSTATAAGPGAGGRAAEARRGVRGAPGWFPPAAGPSDCGDLEGEGPMAGTAQRVGGENGARRYQLFINGKFTDSQSGKTFESVSPHDRSVVAVVAEGDKPDIDAAVAAARAAHEGVW